MRTRAETAGLIYGFLGVCVFGVTLPATRIAVAEFDPLFVSLGRAALAGLVAIAILAATRSPWPRGPQWAKLAIAAAGVVFGFPVLSTLAMQHAPAGHGAIVLALLPLATAFSSVAFAGERPSPVFWLWSLTGCAAVLAYSALEGAFSGGSLGLADLLLVAAVASASIGYAQGGALSRDLGGWQVICWALVIALPVTIAALAIVRPPVNLAASLPAWGSFLYVTLASQLFGFFLWNKGLALGGVARVGQVQLLQTFVTLAAAALIVGEAIEPRDIGFAILVAAIVALGRRAPVRGAAATR